MKCHNIQDPIEQTKFNHKIIPDSKNKDPIPIIHSLSKKNNQRRSNGIEYPTIYFQLEKCYAKGFTIPLEMRLSADGRNLKNVL